MSDLGRLKVEHEARQRAGAPHRSTPFSEAVNRYLGAFSYVDPYAPGPAPAAHAVVDSTATGTVIVGVDDMPSSHIAVDQAAIEAQLRGYGLLILHAGTPSRDPRLLEQLVERIRGFAPEVAVATRVTVGMGAAELLLSEAGDTDLIVVGHRHGATRGVLRRSVADRVAARHPGPVLVVRETGWPPGSELANRPLVVGVNGSAASTRATGFAVREARIRGCDVTLLHVTGEGRDVPDDRIDRLGGVTVLNRTVAGDPVTELVDASGRAAAIVVGRDAALPGLSPVNRAVLHHAHCPVFLAG